MLSSFANSLNKNFPFLQKQNSILVAVSGGIDSVVLTDLLVNCGSNFKLSLAHCNFKLRGQESEQDALFVRKLAENYQIPYFEKAFDTTSHAKKEKLSIQMAARDLRYRWFEEILKKSQIEYIAIAHHFNDSIETFFINLFRGSGLSGLSGISQNCGNIIRPLSDFRRIEILEYAKKQKLDWREDSSNNSSKYLRNQIRETLIPQIKELIPHFEQRMSKNFNHLEGNRLILSSHIKKVRDKLFVKRENNIFISIKELELLEPLLDPYIRELFHPFGFTQYEDIKSILKSQSGKKILSPTHRLFKNREHIIINPLKEKASKNCYLIDENLQSLSLPRLILKIKDTDLKNLKTSNKNILFLDKNQLSFPLKLRKYRSGDFFMPFGMRGKSKRLSKFFKDEKYSLLEKENQWLLCNDEDIIWVVGMRSDERYRVSKLDNLLKVEAVFNL